MKTNFFVFFVCISLINNVCASSQQEQNTQALLNTSKSEKYGSCDAVKTQSASIKKKEVVYGLGIDSRKIGENEIKELKQNGTIYYNAGYCTIERSIQYQNKQLKQHLVISPNLAFCCCVPKNSKMHGRYLEYIPRIDGEGRSVSLTMSPESFEKLACFEFSASSDIL